MKKRIEKLKQKREELVRLDKLGYAKVLYRVYKPSQIELKILRWFNLRSAQKIADRLKINRSYVYATVKKFKDIYTKSELV